MSKLPHQGPTPKCCVRVPGLSDGRHTTLCHRRFWHHHLGQGQLSNTGADGYADPAVSREVTVHRRFDLLTGQGLNLLDLVVEGQGLVKAVDDGQFVAHIQVAGRELWQRDLETYKRSKESNEWHGYSTDIQRISLPEWAYRKD